MASIDGTFQWQFAHRLEWNHSELTTAGGFQVDTQKLCIHFDQVGVPCIARHSNVVVALFPLDGGSIHVAWLFEVWVWVYEGM